MRIRRRKDEYRAFRKINTVLNITNEAPIESQSKNGGIYARAIEFNGSVFGKHDLLFKEKVMDTIFEHYGVPGRLFIEYLIKNIDDRDSWKNKFREYKKEVLLGLTENNAKLDDKVARKIDYFIAVLVSGQLASKALNLPIEDQTIKTIIDECFNEQAIMTDSSPYHEKGMNALRDFIAGSRPQFFTVGDTKRYRVYGMSTVTM